MVSEYLLYLIMNTPSCPRCYDTKIKRNGYTRHKKQRYKCAGCGLQFIDHPTHKVIAATDIDRINKLLLERLSLRGICRVMDVSMPWLLAHIKQLYANVPPHLYILSQDLDFQPYADEQFDKLIYALLEKKVLIQN